MDRDLNILVIDDDVGMTESLADVLELKGYNVEVANCGIQAIDKIKNRTFDFILLDIKMPDMNGVEVFRQIKKINSNTPVVMMTAYVLPELIGQAEEEGVLSVLRKPLDIDALINFLEKLRGEPEIVTVENIK